MTWKPVLRTETKPEIHCPGIMNFKYPFEFKRHPRGVQMLRQLYIVPPKAKRL